MGWGRLLAVALTLAVAAAIAAAVALQSPAGGAPTPPAGSVSFNCSRFVIRAVYSAGGDYVIAGQCGGVGSIVRIVVPRRLVVISPYISGEVDALTVIAGVTPGLRPGSVVGVYAARVGGELVLVNASIPGASILILPAGR